MEEFQKPDEALDRVFDEQAQMAIIARAAALQRDHGQLSTLPDLERAALEAGIEPRFVREAVRLQSASTDDVVTVPPRESSGHILLTVLLAAIAMPAEIVAIAWTRDWLHVTWGVMVIAVLFGLGLPRRSYARWVAALWPMFLVVTIVVFDRFSRLNDRWTFDLFLAAVQGVVALIVNLLASFRARLPSRESVLRAIRQTDER